MHVALWITGVIHRYLYYRETLVWIEWKIKDLLHANSYIFGDREATVLVQKFVAKKQEKERIVFIWGELKWSEHVQLQLAIHSPDCDYHVSVDLSGTSFWVQMFKPMHWVNFYMQSVTPLFS